MSKLRGFVTKKRKMIVCYWYCSTIYYSIKTVRSCSFGTLSGIRICWSSGPCCSESQSSTSGCRRGLRGSSSPGIYRSLYWLLWNFTEITARIRRLDTHEAFFRTDVLAVGWFVSLRFPWWSWICPSLSRVLWAMISLNSLVKLCQCNYLIYFIYYVVVWNRTLNLVLNLEQSKELDCYWIPHSF